LAALIAAMWLSDAWMLALLVPLVPSARSIQTRWWHWAHTFAAVVLAARKTASVHLRVAALFFTHRERSLA